MRTPPNGQPVDGIWMQRARIFRPSTPTTAQTGLLPSFLTDNREPGGQAAAATGSETTATSIATENGIRDDGDVMVTSQHSLPHVTGRGGPLRSVKPCEKRTCLGSHLGVKANAIIGKRVYGHAPKWSFAIQPKP